MNHDPHRQNDETQMPGGPAAARGSVRRRPTRSSRRFDGRPVAVALICAALGLLTPGAQAGYVHTLTATPGLVSYWNLDETAGAVMAADAVTGDAIDGNNPGAFVGVGVTLGDAGPRPDEGWVGFAADNRAPTFSKLPGDRLEMAHATGYAGIEDLTLLGWIRVTDPDVAALHNLFGGLQTVEPSRYVFAVDLAPTGVRGIARGADASQLVLGPAAVTGASAWHFVAMTYQAGTTGSLYWDGVPVATAERPAPAGLDAAAALVFGQDIQDPTRALHGQLDELAVFNRALTGAEVERLFLAAKGQLPYEPGTVATAPYYQTAVALGGLRNHWRFSETSGSTAVDSIAGNNGTFVNVVGAPVALDHAGPTPAEGHDGHPFHGFESDNTSVRFVWNAGANYMHIQDGDVLGEPGTGTSFASGVGALTMALWFKNGFDGEGYIAGFAKAGSTNRYVFSTISLDSSTVRFYATSTNNQQIVSSDIPIDDAGGDLWHHLAQVWDGTEKRLRVYVDGKERFNDVNAAMTANLYTPGGFYLGRDVYGSTRNLGGFVDEVSLFDRALSAAEILELYDAAFYQAPVLVPGDATGNGVVDAADAALLAANWLCSSGVGWGQGDFNEDGSVDDLDLAILAANWSAGAGAAVPEPAAWLLAAAAGLVLLARSRVCRWLCQCVRWGDVCHWLCQCVRWGDGPQCVRSTRRSARLHTPSLAEPVAHGGKASGTRMRRQRWPTEHAMFSQFTRRRWASVFRFDKENGQ
ncbi:MAG: LamG domain-containing protein [Pirellulales bacterium]|nr:LamG domain-containing protein [Pirellulales bacterium]